MLSLFSRPEEMWETKQALVSCRKSPFQGLFYKHILTTESGVRDRARKERHRWSMISRGGREKGRAEKQQARSLRSKLTSYTQGPERSKYQNKGKSQDDKTTSNKYLLPENLQCLIN